LLSAPGWEGAAADKELFFFISLPVGMGLVEAVDGENINGGRERCLGGNFEVKNSRARATEGDNDKDGRMRAGCETVEVNPSPQRGEREQLALGAATETIATAAPGARMGVAGVG
jgi:hypothetical protein